MNLGEDNSRHWEQKAQSPCERMYWKCARKCKEAHVVGAEQARRE